MAMGRPPRPDGRPATAWFPTRAGAARKALFSARCNFPASLMPGTPITGRGADLGSGRGGPRPAGPVEVTRRRPVKGARPAGHTKAPEGTGGEPSGSTLSGCDCSQSLLVAGCCRLRPCGHRGPTPWPIRGSLPGSVPAVLTCPFGQDELYPPARRGHNGLIHELAIRMRDVIPEVVDVVDRLWRKPARRSTA